jgi:lipopolysaccharide/colanic/teichoic acid biosynthesis glycosyltransferase
MYPTIKRILDFSLAIGLLVVTAPLMLMIALAVRLTLGKPVLHRQSRPGLHEKPFTCFKFRTMRDVFDAQGQPLDDELRLTRLGAFLRRSSLDELPQLWNIVRGDLSFIGPRALLERYLPYYTDEEHRRHSVRPGLTGWAQIHGRNYLPFDRRLQMDVWYVDHFSWHLDLRIALATVWMVLAAKDVSIGAFPFPPLDVQRSSSPNPIASNLNAGAPDGSSTAN